MPGKPSRAQQPAVFVSVLLWCIASATAHASTAGTGTFTLDLHGAPPNPTIDGTLDFAPGAGDVLGTPLMLDPSPGTMAFTGTVSELDLGALSAAFELTATTASPGGALLAFTAAGKAACANPSCAGGSVTFVGIVTVTRGSVLPPGALYTIDGTLPSVGSPGVFGLNAFPAGVPTPAGTFVGPISSDVVSFFDSRQGGAAAFLVDLAFDAVAASGLSRFVGTSAQPGAIPGGIGLDAEGFASVFVDVETTASFTPPVRVCFGFDDTNDDGMVDGTSIASERLRVLHRASPDGDFVDVTVGPPPSARVCGDVASLSAFVVGVADPDLPLPTTTTAPSTTSTTVTTTTTSSLTTTLPATTSTSTTTTAPPVCGDGVREDPEECDGDDFGGAACSPGSPRGALLCTLDCRIDRSECARPLPVSSSTTTTTQPPTTTTTLPPGCPVDPTYPSILCRLNDLVLQVEEADIREANRRGLVATLRAARLRVAEAEQLSSSGKARNKLRIALRRLGGFERRLRSLSARKNDNVPAPLRALYPTLSGPLRADIALLRAETSSRLGGDASVWRPV